jgi:hypothetical protein
MVVVIHKHVQRKRGNKVAGYFRDVISTCALYFGENAEIFTPLFKGTYDLYIHLPSHLSTSIFKMWLPSLSL